MVFPQEDDGVVALDLPIRNSLVFNRYAINPTFSFVREQHKYFSINNKTEWTQFENAPETYLASYSGRFSEKIGAGIAVFQQNYGVLTTFGGLLNFAYNAQLNSDNNLTFGLNIGAYKSGVNMSNVITNEDDPSLQNAPSNFLLTVNPGINYGTEFLDFGISVNNLVLYNFESSLLIEDNPKQGIQAHLMHTGYFDGRGFFNDTKFTAILKSEFRKEETILSGLAMINVPKGLWLQIGYNNVYGVSGGLGLNITKQIALEYNIEKSIGELVEFGSSHEITLAYRFIPKKTYDYSGDEKVSGLFTKKRKAVVEISEEELEGVRARAADRRANSKLDAEAIKLAKREAEAQAKLEAEEKAKLDAEEKARQKEEERAQRKAEAEAKLEAENRAKERAAERAKILKEERAKEAAEQKAKIEIEERAKEIADQKAKEETEARAKELADQQAKELVKARALKLANQKAKEEAVARAKAKEEADARAKVLSDQKAKEEADAKAKILAEQKTKEEADARAKMLADQIAKEEADARAKILADQIAKEEAEQQEQEELVTNPKDEIGKTMKEIAESTEGSKKQQAELLKKFDDIVNTKDNDLKDLKEENDLSDQGITVKPKAFKSVSEENNRLNTIKLDLNNVIVDRNDKIKKLQQLYDERSKVAGFTADEITLYYKKEIKRLQSEQLTALNTKAKLETRLETIKVATEYEKRRRIKRAAFDNEEDRYEQDRAMLQNIKRTTVLSDTPLNSSDFDFGEDQGSNIKILKNINNVESGYYLIVAVHSNINRRNEFITKVVASGRTNVDFFHDVNTSKYYIYYDKFDSIEQANKAMEAKGNRPYNIKMSLVKIEN
jgi:type IX secretion system PorP/SprF family membrane protein